MKCKAHTSRGTPCQRHAIKGGTVCIMHGGSAPQVKAAARHRLLALVDKSMAELDTMLDAHACPPAVVLNAITDLTKTVHALEDREKSAEAIAVIDDWLASLKEKPK